MNQTNILATRVTATGAVTTTPYKIKGIYFVPTVSAAAPRVTLTNGNGGAVLLDLDGPISQAASNPVPVQLNLPENGILASASIYLGTLTNVAAITVFYG